MAPLTEVQVRVDKWSKLTLVGSTLLFVVSFMTFLASHDPHHRGHHPHPADGSPEHEGGRIRLHHFAILGLITSFTGVASSFKLNRGWAVAFLVLVLVTEISALGLVGYANSHAAKTCVAHSMGDVEPVSAKTLPYRFDEQQKQKQPVLIAAAEQRTAMKLPNGQVVEEDVVEIEVANKKSKSHSRSHEGKKMMFGHAGPHHRRHHEQKQNEQQQQQPESLGECLSHVRHAGVISSLIVGVIACSLACCGSRYSNSLAEREEEEQTEVVTSCVVENKSEGDDNNNVLMAIVVPTTTKEQPATIVA